VYLEHKDLEKASRIRSQQFYTNYWFIDLLFRYLGDMGLYLVNGFVV